MLMPLLIILSDDIGNRVAKIPFHAFLRKSKFIRHVSDAVAVHLAGQDSLLPVGEPAGQNQPLQIDVGADHRLLQVEGTRGFPERHARMCALIGDIQFASLLDLSRDHALLIERDIRPLRLASHSTTSFISSLASIQSRMTFASGSPLDRASLSTSYAGMKFLQAIWYEGVPSASFPRKALICQSSL